MVTLGKPLDIRTFENYANSFANALFKMGENYQRIDIIFDIKRAQSKLVQDVNESKDINHCPVKLNSFLSIRLVQFVVT